ncbi:hypothetical protein NPIL_548981, partial [Nephila pilipes]
GHAGRWSFLGGVKTWGRYSSCIPVPHHTLMEEGC